MRKNNRPAHWTALSPHALATLRNGLRASVPNVDASTRTEAERFIHEISREIAQAGLRPSQSPTAGSARIGVAR